MISIARAGIPVGQERVASSAHRPRSTPWLAHLWVFLCLLPCLARADYSSSSSVETPAGFTEDNGSASSALTVDSANFAQSFVRPELGTLGASASNSNAGYTSFSRTTFQDSWFCSACEVIFNPLPSGIVPLLSRLPPRRRLDGLRPPRRWNGSAVDRAPCKLRDRRSRDIRSQTAGERVRLQRRAARRRLVRYLCPVLPAERRLHGAGHRLRVVHRPCRQRPRPLLARFEPGSSAVPGLRRPVSSTRRRSRSASPAATARRR